MQRLVKILFSVITILTTQQLAILIYKISKTNFNNSTENVDRIFSHVKPTNQYPDIYYIILDSYSSSATLKKSFDFDNHIFDNFLINKKFYLPSKSRSNYPYTKFSLTSSLNYEYLDKPRYKYDENLFELLKNNKISNYLKHKGYTYIYFDTGYGFKKPSFNEIVIGKDSNIDNSSDNDFFGLFVNTTLLSLRIGEFSQIEYIGFRSKINFAFNSIPEIAQKKNSKFVFLHLICPHPPYLFKEDGSPQKYVPDNSSFAKSAYLAQLKYINSKTQEAVDNILKYSSKEPIIIIQSDHGSSYDNPMELGNKAGLKDRFFILNAIYASNSIQNKFYPGITPVNTFRIILNDIFNENLPLLQDRSYFTLQSPPYKYIDVTKDLDN